MSDIDSATDVVEENDTEMDGIPQAVDGTDVEIAYPESYSDDQLSIANTLCEYLGQEMNMYTRKEIYGIVKFIYQFFGVALDYGWDDKPGWFAVTKDMAYDQIAKMKAEAEILDK
jgi:hypothetical protein